MLFSQLVKKKGSSQAVCGMTFLVSAALVLASSLVGKTHDCMQIMWPDPGGQGGTQPQSQQGKLGVMISQRFSFTLYFLHLLCFNLARLKLLWK